MTMAGQRRPAGLVTGGSRGVGAATVVALAARGYDVAFLYRNKAARAAQVESDARALGAAVLARACDVTQDDQRARLVSALREWRDGLDALVLNASGGLERDLLAADPDYAMHMNRDAQVALLDQCLPLLNPGSTVVFVTSHWAHLYGHVAQIPAYEPIARSKHAGEQALRAYEPLLLARGVRLLVVTGDLIEGTITPKLLERSAPGFTEGWRARTGSLPTAEDFAVAITNAALDGTLPSGHVVVVGNPLSSLPEV
jgi:NAD(P)-dependent dehydrogenase (short-subunit alcohol dehydrogenase family)